MFRFLKFIPHAAALALMFALPPAGAVVNPHIELLEVWRNTTISAEIAVFQTYPNDGELRQGASRRYRDGGEIWGSGHEEIRYPLAISLPASEDHSYSGFGDGQVRQLQQLDVASITVQQLADVNISALADVFTHEISGQGEAQAQARYRFVLHGDALARLDMDSAVNLFREDNVRFSLERELEGGKMETLWDGAIAYDDQWNPVRIFSRKLELPAGTYQLKVSAYASSTLNGSEQRAENSRIDVALIVVAPLCECCRLGDLSKQDELSRGGCR